MTPELICDDVKNLLVSLNSESEPVYVKCIPEIDAELDDCFPLVESKIKRMGGEIVFGWQIWKANFLIEAEFHAIWKTKSGELIDISRKAISPDKILFVQDSNRVYEGKQVDNIRVNIIGNRLVDDFIAVCEASFRLQNTGDKAFKHELTLIGAEAEAYSILEDSKIMLQAMIEQGFNHQSPCICNSGKKYKVCHGKKIHTLVECI
ncbi:SEC-C domain-containing protein [Pseudoalteromonas sp. Z1A6]|uniref:SEC-C metal-binding domain-containing protein n=1 Tax=Pseudoalteromonas sp. Z1A6 TaxID=2686349 RepID=UPI0013FDCE46